MDNDNSSNSNMSDDDDRFSLSNDCWDYLQRIFDNPSLHMRSCAQSLTEMHPKYNDHDLEDGHEEEDNQDPDQFHQYMSLLFPTTRSSSRNAHTKLSPKKESPMVSTASNVKLWKRGITDCFQQERDDLRNKY